ncbi:hypothetical protein [Streptomyces sp. NBC_00199]|uniref:hypothetical protein n=1 Tax=Streptomyces sp. NBC_00199 TaxID=2975678 RepID=UPI002258689D|nr:hypothetical protein [Streptomyces sp. NBC_00199]MCX5268416.1 hypothetical protein [Streptomyces sp. NBC_00199]
MSGPRARALHPRAAAAVEEARDLPSTTASCRTKGDDRLPWRQAAARRLPTGY